MPEFAAYVGIDYSGAATPATRLPGLAVYRAEPGAEPQPVAPPNGRNWTRRELHHWLGGQLAIEPTLAGLDLAFAFPEAYFARFGLADWDAFLADFCAHWPTDQPDTSVEACRAGNSRTGSPDELRLCERWTPSAKSVFRFDVQGAVAKSSHAALPWLLRHRRELGAGLHVWPFDGWRPPAGCSMLAEVYPAQFKRRYAADGRNPHQQDAYAVARWLAEMGGRQLLDRYLVPPLTPEQSETVGREGWILGVT